MLAITVFKLLRPKVCIAPFRPINRTVGSRPNFGYYTETNTVIDAAVAFR